MRSLNLLSIAVTLRSTTVRAAPSAYLGTRGMGKKSNTTNQVNPRVDKLQQVLNSDSSGAYLMSIMNSNLVLITGLFGRLFVEKTLGSISISQSILFWMFGGPMRDMLDSDFQSFNFVLIFNMCSGFIRPLAVENSTRK
ncbi:hypothetical protein HS088_TW16G00393 [Tripterygium wilfordii]|uniref:Uncharacterized protein n=1 Tax=Tripterygium wilfordii TaxID=458696 RepID=A0A7J7CIR0_TRIWF|nr:hypothetical protein HS088_TW16G00393 [Tripterygium wilfordii]